MINFFKWIYYFFDFIIHFDSKLGGVYDIFGTFTLFILFIIIFCESGIILLPFLPGSSLIFAAGALASKGYSNIYWQIVILTLAGISGSQLNYYLGKISGPLMFKTSGNFLLRHKKKYLEISQNYFATYGNKTTLYSSYIPIFRTFTPFIAGISRMNHKSFTTYNIIGTFTWVFVFSFFGYFSSSIPFVKNHFAAVVFAIILLSLLPVGYQYLRKLVFR